MTVRTAMAQNLSQATQKRHFQAFLAHGAREGGVILTVVLCVFLLMSLVSYDPGDPGWTTTGANAQPVNFGGRAGAWCADVLLYLFGYVAFLFPLATAYQAALIFKLRREQKLIHWPLFALRMFGCVLTMLSATALLALYSIAGLDNASGGILGQSLSALLTRNFNLSGATLLLVATLLIGLTLYTGVSWLAMMDRTGAMTLRFFAWARQRLAEIGSDTLDRYHAQRELRAQQKQEPRVSVVSSGASNARVVKAAKVEPKLSTGKMEPTLHAEAPVIELPPAEKEPGALKSLLSKVGKVAEVLPGVGEADSADSAKKIEPVLVDAVRGAEPESGKSGIKISPFVKKSKPAEDPRQGRLFIQDDSPLPSLALLDPPEVNKKAGFSKEQLEHLSRLLEEKLADFGVVAQVVEVNPGPVITRFEIQPAPGVKVSKISNLAKDLARSLAVLAVRVVEVIPGKSVVGIEIPNEHRKVVRFSEVLGSKEYADSMSPVTMALGHDIAGDPVVVNLAKMPHLLVAGTTGSGKSVGVNAMILSILFKATPEEVRFIMVDPKMLELSIYDGIPHLLTPVVTDMKEAANALRWCVAEMERRYKLMANLGVRNLAGYNRKVLDAAARGEPILDPLWQPDQMLMNEPQHQPELQTLPFIVVVIDEFADMMMIVGKKVEELIARIAQKARAAGIHLILATQRPSVDVITGLIKANVPTRISFQVSSKIDSRTILDQGGAEQLLGHGDMLYMPPGTSLPVRVHGAFVDDHEVHKVVDDWKQRGEPNYLEEILAGGDSSDPMVAVFNEGGAGGDSEGDALYDEAVAFVTETRRASISAVQRKLKIGYNRAANLVEAMEAAGVVSAAGHNGTREVLAPPPPRD